MGPATVQWGGSGRQEAGPGSLQPGGTRRPSLPLGVFSGTLASASPEPGPRGGSKELTESRAPGGPVLSPPGQWVNGRVRVGASCWSPMLGQPVLGPGSSLLWPAGLCPQPVAGLLPGWAQTCPFSSPQDDQGGPEGLPPAHLQRARGCRTDQGAARWVPGPGRRPTARVGPPFTQLLWAMNRPHPRHAPWGLVLGPGGACGVSRPLLGSCWSQSRGPAGFGMQQSRGLAAWAALSSRRPRLVSQAFSLSS